MLTDDNEIQTLNKQYRNKDKSTDVLSFSLDEGQGFSSALLGDVVISIETAERQAHENGFALPEEITRLLIHGILHLHGFEHENVAEAKVLAMQAEEKRLFDLVNAELP